MNREKHRLTAEDYSYVLPDHWIIPEETIWEIMRQAYARRVVELIKGSGARSVLEIGCGDGWNCDQFVEAALEKIVGVDWSRTESTMPDAWSPRRSSTAEIRETKTSCASSASPSARWRW